MTDAIPFNPQQGGNKVLSATNTSQTVAINKDSKSVRFINLGSVVCHVRFGTGAVTATSTDTPIGPGETVVIGKSNQYDLLAYITASSTATLHAQAGEGGI